VPENKPQWIIEIALAVDGLVQDKRTLHRFQTMIRQRQTRDKEWIEKEREWRGRRSNHFTKLQGLPATHAWRTQGTPPKPGWKWEDHLFGKEDAKTGAWESTQRICGWVPPKLASGSMPKIDPFFLHFKRAFTSDEKYTLLAVIRDTVLSPARPAIGPCPHPEKLQPLEDGLAYCQLSNSLVALLANEKAKPVVEAVLAEVKRDLDAGVVTRPGGAKELKPFHLADVVRILWADTQEEMSRGRGAGNPAAKYPKSTVHDNAARRYVTGEIVKLGGLSEEQFHKYATNAGLGTTMNTIAKAGRQPDDHNTSEDAAWVREVSVLPSGDRGQPDVCKAIARLHDEGWTDLLLEDIWEEWADVAEARGLPRPWGSEAVEGQCHQFTVEDVLKAVRVVDRELQCTKRGLRRADCDVVQQECIVLYAALAQLDPLVDQAGPISYAWPPREESPADKPVHLRPYLIKHGLTADLHHVFRRPAGPAESGRG